MMDNTQLTPSNNYTLAPFAVLVDTREQYPFSFRGFTADADRKNLPLVVPVRSATLRSGDYSLDGFADQVAVERKSLQDAYQTFGRERDRFERELARLNDMQFAAVVIEAGWPSIIGNPPSQSNVRPKTIYRSVLAWQQRFPRVHWWACDTRSFAERTTLRILQRFWLERQKQT